MEYEELLKRGASRELEPKQLDMASEAAGVDSANPRPENLGYASGSSGSDDPMPPTPDQKSGFEWRENVVPAADDEKE